MPYFIDNDIGWIPYATGRSTALVRRGLLHTTDGGRTWDTVATPGSSPGTAFFPDKSHGWFYTAGMGGSIYRTSDGGATWESAHAAMPLIDDRVFNPRTLYFRDSLHGVAAGDNGVIVSTSDGGDSWNIAGDGFSVEGWRYFSDISFSDDLTGWAIGGSQVGLVARTTDGGQHWTGNHLDPAVDCCEMRGISFSQDGWGIIVGSFPLVTLDEGNTWNELHLPEVPGYLYLTDVSLAGIGTGMISGLLSDSSGGRQGGVIFRTGDRGRTWTTTLFEDVATFFWVELPTPSTGYAVSSGKVWKIDQQSDVVPYREQGPRHMDLRP